MDSKDESLTSTNLLKCCNCVCKCSSPMLSSSGTWIRSVKRKYDEFEDRRGGRFYIPGLDHLRIARVEMENECVALRETVTSQQNTIQDLYMELDEERNASSSAADEAMSMILRLQREKAEVEMEARQFMRFAEEKRAHDAREIAALEDLLYKREQTIQSLTCEVQAYKHRMMSYGLTEAEAEAEWIKDGGYSRNQRFSDFGGLVESPTCAYYPPLKCNPNNSQEQSDFDDGSTVDVEKYAFSETPRNRERLKRLAFRINRLERTSSATELDGYSPGSRSIIEKEKVVVGHSPRRARHWRRFSTDSSNSFLKYYCRDFRENHYPDSPRLGTSFKKMDCVVEELRKTDSHAPEFGEHTSDRVYTLDSVNQGASYNSIVSDKVPPGICEDYTTTPRGADNMGDGDEFKKLCLRLQALEADRESSLKERMIRMQTDKAQLVLLREIAQQLCKDMSSGEKGMPLRKPSVLEAFSFVTIFKWVWSLIWRRKVRRTKPRYTFGPTPSNLGLLMLLEKSPRARPWRCLRSTQL